jgi:phosphate transport system substrate-binding protein
LADFLCKLSPAFLAKAGRGESPKWPVGASAGRAQDMADMVRSTPWSIGYTELNLAQTASLRVAKIRNAAGEFVLPTVNSIAAAAAESKIKNDFRVSLINAPGAASYPITSFTWLYVPAKSRDAERGRAVADYLRWVYEDGQRIAQEQGYATLPKELLAKVAASAATVRQALPVELVGGGSGPGATKDDVERHAGTHSGAKRADRADTVHPLNH